MTHKDKGQVMPVLLLVVMAVLVVAVVSYNSSRATVSKMELINAADGAAYSGALQTARSMNFMAYTSRGMISNTIGAGYMVAYVSHLRHLAAVVDEISKPRQLLAKLGVYAGKSMLAQGQAFTEFSEDYKASSDDDSSTGSSGSSTGSGGSSVGSSGGSGSESGYDGDTERGSSASSGGSSGSTAGPPSEMVDWNELPGNPYEDDAYQSDSDLQSSFDSEAQQTNQANQSVGGNKFQRAGRFGGAVLDAVATTIGYGTIPLTDMLNTAYAGIQLAEYAAINQAVNGTMEQVAAGYGEDIAITDENVSDAYAWMVPMRPGIDGFGVKIPKEFPYNLGKAIRERGARTGNPIGQAAGWLSGLMLGALDDEGGLKRNSDIPLSPMKRLIGGSITFYDDERYMVWERAWRVCAQFVPGSSIPIPLVPIPTNPLAEDRLDVFVTPPCTPPLVPPALPGMAQVAMDKTGGASFTFAQKAGSESGSAILNKRKKTGAGGSGPNYSDAAAAALAQDNPYQQGASSGGVSLTAQSMQGGSIADQADTPQNQARRSGYHSTREYADLSDRSPMRQATQQTQQTVIEQFRNRLYSSGLGERSGVAGLVQTLSNGAAWGADWQSEDKIELGAFVWRPKFGPKPPFIKLRETLYGSKFQLEGNELAWGGATAKEFWPTYQGVPLYMTLTEFPWTDGFNLGIGPKRNGRVIDVKVRRPADVSLMNMNFMEAPKDIEFEASARGEIFYYRQPHDDDNAAEGFGGSTFGYFPDPGVEDASLLSPFAAVAADVLATGDVEWFNLITNWYGQKWANTQVAIPIMLDLLKPDLGISTELPNLMTPFWDARLAKL